MSLFFAIATTIIWGVAEILYKKSAHPNERYAHLRTCICVGLVMGIHAVFTLTTQKIQYDPVNLIRYLPVSMLYILSMAFSYFGMRFLEESIDDPIENTSGAMCSVLCAIFLGDRIAAGSWVAIGIMVVGILGLGFLEKNGSTDRRKKLGKQLAFIAFLMPFLYAVLDAVGSFLDVFYLEDITISPLVHVTEDTVEMVANTSYELTFALVAVLLLIFLRIKRVPFELPKQGDKILAAVCETAGQFTYVYAMSSNGAVAAPIISSVCVVSLLLSRIFLKERLTGKQYIFIGLVIIGILSLAIIEGQ